MFIAHTKEETDEVQSVKEHCCATASLAEKFSVSPFKDILYNTGILHDIGKYQPSFQKKITSNQNIKIEHSICGAIEAEKRYKSAIGSLMEYCIAGHHSGIPDGGNSEDSADMPTLYGRMGHTTENYFAYKSELSLKDFDEMAFLTWLLEDCKNNEDVVEKFAFATRYCFSCLTDADSIDTAFFCCGETNQELQSDFTKCLEKINSKFENFVCTTELQKCRSKLQQQVYEKVNIDSEIYLMNMPTGSGKTLCSMKFALERAIRTGKRRIIYIIPYNSIIDQTAELFENMFGDSAMILRHQSSFSYDDTDLSEDYKEVIRHSTENWNAQIIITTAVQFFESVYANKRNKLRKMHNMADSILVFDEAHLMPKNHLQPCLKSIAYITRLLNSEAVFLTATMPDFKKLITKYALKNSCITDLIEDKSLFEKFNKCSYKNIGTVEKDALINLASNNPSTLIVVNSRKTARELYSICSGKKFHLSTYMSAFDRKRVINEIKKELLRLETDYPNLENVPDHRKITVISTSLIEAGVDLDFFCVFRESSELDSILQAGGRCNREGKREKAVVNIFNLDNGAILRNSAQAFTQGIIEKYEDISCSECITEYYDRLFEFTKDDILSKAISDECKDIREIPFATYSKEFEIIDKNTISVVVAQNETSKKLVEALKYCEHISPRKFQKYTFTVHESEFEDLLKQHAINDFGSGIWCITNPDYYDKNIGVLFEAPDYYV